MPEVHVFDGTPLEGHGTRSPFGMDDWNTGNALASPGKHSTKSRHLAMYAHQSYGLYMNAFHVFASTPAVCFVGFFTGVVYNEMPPPLARAMAALCAPKLKPLRAFCKTATQGVAVAGWVTKHTGIEVTYDACRKGWAHDGDNAAVDAALAELSHRILYFRVTMHQPHALTMTALRRRLAHWRSKMPDMSIYTWPNTRGTDVLPDKLSVWVVAMPSHGYPFAEATSEFQGLCDRFTVVSWAPHGECSALEGAAGLAFATEHGLGGMSRRREDGTFLMFGTAENVMSGVESLACKGHIVRTKKV